ncbi:EamA family transporter [Glycomyces luteolus]|uniref:EamA family transporter n=1 Tax=Glycomyces luteolus TaxID=2670330 RepID=A0A9X3SP56_9ACTN|nr:EamA family transporter [Glycomyces luteolus]MDA1358992.1 EamA family transporter [Glycomyces luteolus]
MTAATQVEPGSGGRSRRVMPSRPVLVVVALAIVYVVWGSTYLGIRIMVEDMPPMIAAGARFLCAAIVLAVILMARGGLRRLALTRAEVLSCALIGLLLPVLGQGMVTVAENGGAPSGLVALLIAAVPLFVLMYRLFAGERPKRATVLGVLMGFAGLALLLATNGIGGDFPFWALALVVFSSASWAFGSWLQPRLEMPRDAFVAAVYEMAIGGALLFAVGLGSGEPFTPAEYSAKSWAAWVYLVVFGSVVAFSAYVWLLQAANISLVATYAYVNPLVAVFLGWLILSEAVTAPIIAGGAIVIAAVILVVSTERPQRKPPITEEPDHG